MDSAGVVIWTTSSGGVFTSLNPAFEATTGWRCDEWIGRPFLNLVHPDEAQRADAMLARAIDR